MRLFVAIPVPDGIRRHCQKTMEGMRLASHPHLTLRFIGNAPAPGAFLEALAAIDHKPLTLAISGVGLFKKGFWLQMLTCRQSFCF